MYIPMADVNHTEIAREYDANRSKLANLAAITMNAHRVPFTEIDICERYIAFTLVEL